MSKTIWKYPVTAGRWTQIMPVDAEILSVQVQHKEVQMWVLVDPDAITEAREFDVYGTGHLIPESSGKFIGTFQIEGGALVFHLFECESTARCK